MTEPSVVFAGVRDGGDEWHIECRMSDGQKFAVVTVAVEFESLAHRITDFLNGQKGVEGLAALFEERHYLGVPYVGDNPSERAVMVDREWYGRLRALAKAAANNDNTEDANG